MSMHDTDHFPESLHGIAAFWHMRLRAEPDSVALQRDLMAWLDADVEHRLAYAEVCAADYACEQILVSKPYAERQHGAPVFGGPPRPLRQPAMAGWRRPRRAFVAVALAASVVVMLLAPGVMLGLRADHIGQPGQVAQHILEDGSVLSLDGSSAARVRYQSDGRHVEVLRGAVHVDVRSDLDRPFVVRSGNLEARALGTRYAVSRVGERQRVAVDAGHVAVRIGDGDAVALQAGRMLSVNTDGSEIQFAEAGASDIGWLAGQLVFSATPFDEAVAAIARHLPERVVLSRHFPDDAVTAIASTSEARQLLERLGRERGYRSTRIPGLLIVLH